MISKSELKRVKSLKVKKYRLREKRFIVEGAKNVLELIKSSYDVETILCSEDFYQKNQEDLSNCNAEVVSAKTLNDVGSFKNNDSCIAVVHLKEHSINKLDLGKQLFVLDGVSDPGNLGTIIRTLDWFGFNQLVCSQDSAELHNPKVINSTMGSFTRVKVCYVDLGNFLDQCDLPKYGAEMEGLNLFEMSIDKPSIIVMGSESHGISETVKSKLDHSINVPKYGNAESLNVAIATGIIAGYLRIS